MPILHGDDVEIGADVVFPVEELREFSDGEAIAHGKGKVTLETGCVPGEYRTLDDIAADGIGPVEKKKGDVELGGFFHAVRHGDRIREEAHAGVRKVEDERVNAFEHVVGGAERFAVEAVDGKTGGGVTRGGNFFVEVSGETVFGAEERNEMHAGRARENLDRGAALRIETRVIGDEADVFTTQRRELLRFQNVDAGLHAARASGSFGSGSVKRMAERKCEGEPSGQVAAAEADSMGCSGAVHRRLRKVQ